jgi:hypothetical protein
VVGEDGWGVQIGRVPREEEEEEEEGGGGGESTRSAVQRVCWTAMCFCPVRQG